MQTVNRFLLMGVAAAATLVAAVPGRAQSASRQRTDPRWSAWLGCWQSDSSDAPQRSGASSTVCVVPVAGTAGVEALTITRGKITMREALPGDGTLRAIDGQGCKGAESTIWSASGRRHYLRSNYTC